MDVTYTICPSKPPTIESLILNIQVSRPEGSVVQTGPTVVVTPGPIYQLITTRLDC